MTQPQILDYPSNNTMYKPLKGKAMAAVILLSLVAVFKLPVLAMQLWFVVSPDLTSMQSTPAGGITTKQMTFAVSIMGSFCIYGIAFILAVIFFCMWVYRANANLHALKTPRMEFTPGWSVGWWFIPIMNLFKPFLVMKELWLASDSTSTAREGMWESGAAPMLMVLWWGIMVTSAILSRVSFVMLRVDTSVDTIRIGGTIDCVASALDFVGAILIVLLVRKLTQRIETLAESLPASMPAAQ